MKIIRGEKFGLIEAMQDDDGRVLAQNARDFEEKPPGTRRYTLFCTGGEELDIDALTNGHAVHLGTLILEEQYESGIEIEEVQQRFGLYF